MSKKNSARIERYQDESNEWRWRMVTANGRNLANAGEGYKRRGMCDKAIARLRELFPVAVVIELPTESAPAVSSSAVKAPRKVVRK
jgi:uncharacterized protein YegP (UPF0339 family)